MEDITDGIVLVDKPSGITSFGVVARVRRRLSEKQGKKVKVGHTGTLDPFATGLMILVVGKECKNAGKYSKLDKIYEAIIRLGATSSTGDPEGEITQTENTSFTPEKSKNLQVEIERVLQQFVGEIKQTPPAFSAVKINGQRAYKLARKGEKVDIPVRTVTVYSLELLHYSYPDLHVRARVSSGTYIRSLAEDIGSMLGMGAYCAQLRRIKIADYDVESATAVEA